MTYGPATTPGYDYDYAPPAEYDPSADPAYNGAYGYDPATGEP